MQALRFVLLVGFGLDLITGGVFGGVAFECLRRIAEVHWGLITLLET